MKYISSRKRGEKVNSIIRKHSVDASPTWGVALKRGTYIMGGGWVMILLALARSGNLLDKTTGGLGAFAIGEADVRYCSAGEI